MTLSLTVPDSLKLSSWHLAVYGLFLQKMLNRRSVGAYRYSDKPVARQRYLSRLKRELSQYEKTGNAEHLLNIANYCYLESEAPEHPNAHFNPFVKSATRSTKESS